MRQKNYLHSGIFTALLGLLMLGCGDRSRTAAPSEPVPLSVQIVAALGGRVFLEDGAGIDIPADVFATDVEVTLQVVDPKGVPPTAAGSILVGPVYEIEARVDGEEAKPWGAVNLNLPYHPSEVPAGFAEADLVGVYWDGSAWVDMTSAVDLVSKVVSVQPRHLSRWSVSAHSRTVEVGLELPNASDLFAGDRIHVRVKASSLNESSAPRQVELQVRAALHRMPASGFVAREGILHLSGAQIARTNELSLFSEFSQPGDILLTLYEEDLAGEDGYFDVFFESGRVHPSVGALSFSARVGSGRRKVETDPLGVVFFLPPPPAIS